MRVLNDDSIALLKQWEGLRLTAYQDEAGVWTIGHGHTATAAPGMRITADEAEMLFRGDLEWARRAVSDLIAVPLTDNQYGALVSFTFNLGRDALKRSTLRRKLNRGDYAAIPSELAKWNKLRDARMNKLRKSNGLTNRRAAEAGLWARGAHVAGGAVRSAPIEAPHPVRRRQVVAAVASAAGGALAKSAAEILTGTGPVSWAIAGVIVLGAVAGIGILVYRYAVDTDEDGEANTVRGPA